jgi:hypothetical protein
MDPEFWYQQHTLDSDAQHLNPHMIDIVQKCMRGDATRMKTYIKLGVRVWEHNHCKGIFARSKLTLDAIQSMHPDFYELPDEARVDTSPKSSNQKNMALERSSLMFFVP